MSQHGPYLIFGGVGGIGEALARRLRQTGAEVWLTSRSLDRAQGLAQEIGAHALSCDATADADVAAACAAASASGTLAGLAYCVGSIVLKPLSRVSADDMLDAYRLNVVGAALAVKHATAALKAGTGAVVLFSSVAAAQGFPNHVAIGSAKAGVEGLARSLAAELAPHVRVNAIAPSLTATPLAAPMLANEKMAEAIAQLHPLPRLGDAGEIAALAHFLLSKESAWMTGQVIGVDGGRSTLRTGKA
jgi:NAD(P)-dependent dehydrogenase (short-subunit alcohol dehydrogenase family)